MNRTILVFVARYLPGFKSGGPIRSIAGLVAALGDEFDFRIVTGDRDSGDTKCYAGVKAGLWSTVGKAQVLYLSPESQTLPNIFRLLRHEKADVLYLNSFFGRPFSIFPMLARSLGARAQEQVILAPRGEFSPSALRLSPYRKRTFAELAKRMACYHNICWHASSPREEQDIRREFGQEAHVRIALPISLSDAQIRLGVAKKPGTLKIAFIARIVPMKNLLQALEMLRDLPGQVEFNIYGPPEDRLYWERCLELIGSFPSDIRVRSHGFVPHDEVAGILSEHHLLFLPTLGENYGHSIFDALSVGCPVLISDRTPWKGLESSGAGWDLPLDRPDLFRQALESCVALDEAGFRTMRANAQTYVQRFTADRDVVGANRALFSRSTLQRPEGAIHGGATEAGTSHAHIDSGTPRLSR